ncbi:MFS general substrate transporter [Colletotrichum somersetense]|nr:MFS general substrate transporter [Colletotrichum somersetense]
MTAYLERNVATAVAKPGTPETVLEDMESSKPEPNYWNLESSPLAWVCVIGSFLFLYPSYGKACGTVQSYLQQNQLSVYSSSDLGWISGIFTSLCLLLGIQTGPLMDAYGTKFLAPISVTLYFPMFFALGECTEYWHFILCLGVLGGIAVALTATVAIAVIGKLFNRRKGLAMGIALSGSSVTKGAVLNFSPFQSSPFRFIAAGSFLIEFVLFDVTGLMPTFAMAAGFGSEAGFNLIAILNGASCFGRITTGMAGDRLGRLNILITMISFTILITGVILVPFGTKHIGALYAFAALWGYGSGSFLSTTPVCVGKTCEPKHYGRYVGTMNFLVSFSLLVTVPVGGQMLESMGGMALSGFYLTVIFLGSGCFFAARTLLLDGQLTFRARV